MLVTIVIMIVVLLALFSIFDMSLRVFSFGNNKVEATESARLGMEKMEREIRAAYPVDANNADTYLFFSANGSTSNPPQAMPAATQITFGNELGAEGAGNGTIDCRVSPLRVHNLQAERTQQRRTVHRLSCWV